MPSTQLRGPLGARRNKGGAAYAGQGDGANQVEQTAETAGNGGEGECGRHCSAALCGHSHPFSAGGGAGRRVGVRGLRPLWGGPGGGGGVRSVRRGGAGGSLLRLYGAAGLCGWAAVCRRGHIDLCGELCLLRHKAAPQALGHASDRRAHQWLHRLHLPVRGRLADGGCDLFPDGAGPDCGGRLVLPAAAGPHAGGPGGGAALSRQKGQSDGAAVYRTDVPVRPVPGQGYFPGPCPGGGGGAGGGLAGGDRRGCGAGHGRRTCHGSGGQRGPAVRHGLRAVRPGRWGIPRTGEAPGRRGLSADQRRGGAVDLGPGAASVRAV